MSGFITVVGASRTPADGPASAGQSGDAGWFGDVLSVKLAGQAAADQGSPLSSPRKGAATSETVPCKNQETGKAYKEKPNGAEYVSTQAAVAASAILPAQSLRSAAQRTIATFGSSANPINSSTQTSTPGDGPEADAFASHKVATSADTQCPVSPPALASVADNPPGAQAREPIQSASLIDKEAAAGDGGRPSLQSTGDDQQPSTFPFARMVASEQVQPTNEGAAEETWTPSSETRPNATPSTKSQPETTQQSCEPLSEGKSKHGLEDAAAISAAGPAHMIKEAASTAEAQSELPQPFTLPHGATAPNNNAAPKSASDGSNHTQRKRDASGSKPPQPEDNGQSDAPPQQSVIGDSLATTLELTQSAPAATLHDSEDKSGKPTIPVLPEAGHPLASALEDKSSRPQIASHSTASSPVEDAQAVPVVIQSARVLDRMGQVEMRLGLNSNKFGSIELHTSVNQDRVGANIATSHIELRAAMMAEMPSLERAIAQHQLTLDNLNMDSGLGPHTGNSGDFSRNSPASRSWNQSAGKISDGSKDSVAQEVSVPQTWAASPYSSGLNVHA